jgi:hypothetical protein
MRIDHHRVVVHQAAGMLTVHLGVPVAQALAGLRAQAVASGQPTWPEPL